MATRAVQNPTLAGVAPTYHPADAAGDLVPTGDNVKLLIRNAGTAAVTATVETPGLLPTGDYPDAIVSVPAGGQRLVGPLQRQLFGNAQGLARVTWSAVASVDFIVLP